MKNVKSTKKNKTLLVILTIVTILYMSGYLIWRLFFTIPDHSLYGWVPTILGIALFAAEFMSAIEAFAHSKDLLSTMEPELPVIPKDWYPDVDVFIATHNEEEELLFKTINGCTFMDYPDKSKVHIYVCDDGDRPEIKTLAERMGVGYFGLSGNKLAKAGNLNNALSKTASPLVVTFDADMIPSSNFLTETVPYFFLPKMKKDDDGNWIPKTEEEIDENEKIGFIQLPQSFYNPDLFQYNLFMEGTVPNEQDYFFRQVNIGRNKSNSAIYAGSNTVILREALEEVGGIKTGTITEDFETGIAIEMLGYKCYAVNKLLAKGLAPTSIGSLIKQRERWGRGCVYSLRRIHLFLNPKIPYKMKVAYGACRTYWDSFLRRFIYILSPIVCALCGIPIVVCGLKELLLIWLPAYLLYGITLRLASGNIRSSRLSNIIDTIMFPYLMIPIFAEFLFIHKKEFHVTNKSRENDNSDRILVLPHLVLLVLSIFGILKMAGDTLACMAFGNIIIIYWLFVNGSALLMAVFFMLGRKNYRNYERFDCRDIAVDINYKGNTYKANTLDISEGGFCVEMEHATYLPYKEGEKPEMFDVTLYSSKYSCDVVVEIIAVAKDTKNNIWKYSFEIVSMDEYNKKQYMQLIFDREHTLPKKISVMSSVYGDVLMNITGRINKKAYSKRKLARIDIGKSYPVKEGGEVKIVNFNFEHIYLGETEKRKELNIILSENVVLKCVKLSLSGNIYNIENLNSLINNKEFEQIVLGWENNGLV